MGRPIKRKFFGLDNVNDGLTYSDAGGEGLASITLTNRGSAYSQGLTATVAVSPIGGTRGVISVAINSANGRIETATVSTAGTGYTTAPAITLVKPSNVATTLTTYTGSNVATVGTTTGLYVGMTANAGFGGTSFITSIFTGNSNVVMSTNTTGAVTGVGATFGDTGASGQLTAVLASVITTANTIQANAWTTTGTIGQQADIVSQRSSRRYRVTNATETAVCRLVPSMLNTPTAATVTSAGGPTAAGEMTIEATDSAGGTYWVVKLDSRTCTLVPGGTGTPGSQFAANAQAIWTSTGSAVVDTTVTIATNN